MAYGEQRLLPQHLTRGRIELCGHHSVAELLEGALRGHLGELLTMDEAALESGYTPGHLRRLNREGKLPIEADGGILRRHLPKKPGTAIASRPSEVSSSRVQLARTVANGG